MDRYYRAWTEYLHAFGIEPNGDQLSRTDRGFTGCSGGAVSPSTLRRYLPEFRIYTAWQQYLEDQGTEPTADELAQILADRGIVGHLNPAAPTAATTTSPPWKAAHPVRQPGHRPAHPPNHGRSRRPTADGRRT